MIKSMEIYCTLYLEKFKISVILKSGIYYFNYHLWGFLVLALNPQVSDLKPP